MAVKPKGDDDGAAMDKPALKKAFMLARRRTLNVGLANDNGTIVLLIDKLRRGRALASQLQQGNNGVRDPRFGQLDSDPENRRRIILTLNRPAPSLARRLVKSLKGTGVNKVLLRYDDGTPEESDEEIDDEAEAEDETDLQADDDADEEEAPARPNGAAVGGSDTGQDAPNGAAGSAPASVSGPETPPGATGGKAATENFADDLHKLRNDLAARIHRIREVAGQDHDLMHTLRQQAVRVHDALKQQDAEGGKAQIATLRKMLDDAAGGSRSAGGVPAPDAVAAPDAQAPVGQAPDGVPPPVAQAPDGVPPPVAPAPDGVPPPVAPAPDGVPPPVAQAPDGVPPPVAPAPDGVPPPVAQAPDGVPPPVAPAPDGVPPPVAQAPDGIPHPVAPAPDGVPPPVAQAPDGVPPPVALAPDGVPPPVAQAPDGVPPPVAQAPDGVPPPVAQAPDGVAQAPDGGPAPDAQATANGAQSNDAPTDRAGDSSGAGVGAAATGPAAGGDAAAKANPRTFVKMQQSRLIWNAARKKVGSEIEQLRKAVLQVFEDDPDEAAIHDALDQLDEVMEKFDDRLLDALDALLKAGPNSDQHDELLAEAKEIIGDYESYAKTSPLVRQLDGDTPLGVKLSIASTMSRTLNGLRAALR